jgi:hypothetical protein
MAHSSRDETLNPPDGGGKAKVSSNRTELSAVLTRLTVKTKSLLGDTLIRLPEGGGAGGRAQSATGGETIRGFADRRAVQNFPGTSFLDSGNPGIRP